MHGLVVGQVTDVRLAYDADKDAIVAPVRFEIEPERIVGIGKQVFKTDAERWRRFQAGIAGELAERQPDHRTAECGA